MITVTYTLINERLVLIVMRNIASEYTVITLTICSQRAYVMEEKIACSVSVFSTGNKAQRLIHRQRRPITSPPPITLHPLHSSGLIHLHPTPAKFITLTFITVQPTPNVTHTTPLLSTSTYLHPLLPAYPLRLSHHSPWPSHSRQPVSTTTPLYITFTIPLTAGTSLTSGMLPQPPSIITSRQQWCQSRQCDSACLLPGEGR